MKLINQKKIYNDILQFSQIKNNLIFGICLGMQILFDEGKENGETKGLGLIEGSVDLIRCKKSEKLPLVGWYNSKINVHENFKFLSKFNNEKFYHIHSYVASPIHPNNILGKSSYKGNTFCSITTNGSNILGTQFHPEKSSNIGLEFIQTLFKQID
jgi:glutamine amidotransferase